MPTLPSDLVKIFLAHGGLPLSRSIGQVQGMLRRADYNACDLAEHLKVDPTLAARVMAVANSSFFSRRPCESIDAAVNRLGTLQLTRIFSHVLANAAMIHPLRSYGLPADALWRRSVITAVGAEMAADRAGDDRSSAYMVGLLHQVGMLVVDRLWVSQGEPRKLATSGFEREYTADERQLFGHDQSTFGAELLRQLAFPDSVVRAIGQQYAHPADPIEDTLYVGRLVRACVYDTPPVGPHDDVLRKFGLGSTSKIEEFVSAVREETQKVAQVA